MLRGQKRAVVTISDEAREYKQAVASIALACGFTAPYDGRVRLDLQLYPHAPKDARKRATKLGEAWDDSVRCIDLDNALKVTIDSLKGIAFHDDNQIWEIRAHRMEPIGDGMAVVIIQRVSS